MNNSKRFFPALIALLLFHLSAFAQTPANSVYDQHVLFNPLFYPVNGNEYRSAGGAPGPKYWQNRADYMINCTLDTVQHTVTGSVTIGYTNNSPDDLPFLWLQVDQNIFMKIHAARQQILLLVVGWQPIHLHKVMF
jgi:hypothetical protein